MNIYDYLAIGASIVVLEGIVGIPILIYLLKQQRDYQISEVFRIFHNITYDFNHDILNKINDSDDKTKELFVGFRLYMYDKFKEHLNEIKYIASNKEVLDKIQQIQDDYEEKNN